MWAPVATPVRPENSTVHISMLVCASNDSHAVPVPVPVFGGTSLVPARAAIWVAVAAGTRGLGVVCCAAG